MAARGTDLIPVVQKSYDLRAGLYTHVNGFPRAERSLLGRVIPEDALAMLVSLTVANRRTDKTESLREASGRLDALRITLRLGKHLGFVSNGGYADLSKGADEVGRMLGVRSTLWSPTVGRYLRRKLGAPALGGLRHRRSVLSEPAPGPRGAVSEGGAAEIVGHLGVRPARAIDAPVVR